MGAEALRAVCSDRARTTEGRKHIPGLPSVLGGAGAAGTGDTAGPSDGIWGS